MSLPSIPSLFTGIDPFTDVLNFVIALLAIPTLKTLAGITIGLVVVLGLATIVVRMWLSSINPGVSIGGERYTLADYQHLADLAGRVTRSASVIRKDGD